MSLRPRIRSCTLFLLGLLLALPAAAQGTEEWSFAGGFQAGFRLVDVDGREEKYREDEGLDDGPRLFRFGFELAPPTELRRFFDRTELEIRNAGGDPFSTTRVSVEKYGKYSFSWDHRESDYFREDIILPPALADPALANAGDQHTYDYRRVRDSADLKIRFNKSALLTAGFNRTTKRGQSTTTYDIQRDEFEFERPVEESSSDYNLGFTYRWDRTTLILEERIRQYENAVEVFLPGASLGADPANATLLDYFFLEQPLDLTGLSHNVRLVTHAGDRFVIKLNGTREDTQLDFDFDETYGGTDYTGVPIVATDSGDGEVDRDVTLLGVEVTCDLSPQIGAIASIEHRSLSQEGGVSRVGGDESRSWDIETVTADLGVEIHPVHALTFSAGLTTETRDVEYGATPTVEKTEHTGAFLGLGWRPRPDLRVNVRLEDSSYDDPLALAAPSDRRVLQGRVRYAPGHGFLLATDFRSDAVENATSGWKAGTRQIGLRLGYTWHTVNTSLGYSLMSTDRSIDQTVTTLPGFMGGLQLFYPIAYDADSDIFDARVMWAVSPRLKLGGDVRVYRNDGAFPIDRDSARVYAEVRIGRSYVAHLGYRHLDYAEGDDGFDEYQAGITEISLGYRW